MAEPEVATPTPIPPSSFESPALPEAFFPESPAADPNQAVQHCCSAYAMVIQAARRARRRHPAHLASLAYRNAMPYLTDRDAIRDFTACVAQGVTLGVFRNYEARRLMRAARAAIAALPRSSRPPGRPRKVPFGQLPENQ